MIFRCGDCGGFNIEKVMDAYDKPASIADTAGAKPVAQVSIREGFIVGGINYGLLEGKHEVFAAPPAPSVADETESPVDEQVTAFQMLRSALQADAEYAWAWHCNLAMPIMDSIRCTPAQANKAGADLMRYLFGIDVRRFPEWHHDEPAPSTPSVAEKSTAALDAEITALRERIEDLEGELYEARNR